MFTASGGNMKSTFVRTALAGIAFTLTVTAAEAANNPIPGVDVVIKRNCPCGHAIPVPVRARTDANGQVSLKGMAPGNYVAQIDDKRLVASLDSFPTPGAAKNRSYVLDWGLHSSSGQSGYPRGSGQINLRPEDAGKGVRIEFTIPDGPAKVSDYKRYYYISFKRN